MGIYPVMGGYSYGEVVTITHTGGKGVGRGDYHCDASDWLQVQVATMLLYDLLCMIMMLVLVGADGCYHHA